MNNTVTTQEVRNVMRKYSEDGRSHYFIWTNKTTNDTSNRRRVKCRKFGATGGVDRLINELVRLAGADNVKTNEHSIIVKCILA